MMHTDNSVWEVILNSNGPVSISKDASGNVIILPPKSIEEQQRIDRERKARTSLLMALPEDHLASLHHMDDAKMMWAAIKSRFGGNSQSKKMKKFLFKFMVLVSQMKMQIIVFEYDVMGATSSASNTPNMAFNSAERTSGTNSFNTA
ncbi:hypothetical protein Tco_0177220, partial [Tanacetum coccineum]